MIWIPYECWHNDLFINPATGRVCPGQILRNITTHFRDLCLTQDMCRSIRDYMLQKISHFYWKYEGEPQNRSLDHWLRAENDFELAMQELTRHDCFKYVEWGH